MEEFSTSSLERLIPDEIDRQETTGTETLQIHLERYRFAAQYVEGRVLDMACGVGYGSFELCSLQQEKIEELIGVDISEESVAYAHKRYANPKIEFICANAFDYQDKQGFDTIVSLETIEHLPNPQKFIQHLVSLLKPNGKIIASVPVTPSVDANPYHLNDFTPSSFRKLFAVHRLTEIAHFQQVQPFKPFNVLMKKEKRTQDLRKNLWAYYFTHPKSLLKRIGTTLRHGFENHYLTLVLQAKK